MEDKILKLKEWIAESDNVVFFGGAGVSTESGIPDFRSVDGLYNQKWKYPPETILSHTFFERYPEEYYRFHREKLVIDGVKPNRAHLRLAELEREGKLKAVITQNIDGLHQAAGSREVLELHGSILRAYCARCRKIYPESIINHGEGVPRCGCGGVIRPDIVLYEEQLDQDILYKSVDYIRNADVLIIGGTSLNVYPAAGLINYYRGNKLVLVNLSQTPYDNEADLVINEKIGEVFSRIWGAEMKKGKLIVLEGIDGSGKSSQYRRLCERMEKNNIAYNHIVFPRYDKDSSALIRMYLGGQFGQKPGDVNPYAASTFYAVDRFASYRDDWGKVYENGGIIISDRYTTSNAVHQGCKLPDDELPGFFSWLADLEYNKMGLPEPDLVIYLDVDVETSLSRMKQRQRSTNTTADIHERDVKYLERCLHTASRAAEHYGWKRIDFMKDGLERGLDEKNDEIYSIILQTLGNK